MGDGVDCLARSKCESSSSIRNYHADLIAFNVSILMKSFDREANVRNENCNFSIHLFFSQKRIEKVRTRRTNVVGEWKSETNKQTEKEREKETD